MKKECYEEEVQPYRKTDYKPIIIIMAIRILRSETFVYISRIPFTTKFFKGFIQNILKGILCYVLIILCISDIT